MIGIPTSIRNDVRELSLNTRWNIPIVSLFSCNNYDTICKQVKRFALIVITYNFGPTVRYRYSSPPGRGG